MQIRLRTLLILLAVAPPLLAASWFYAQSIRGLLPAFVLIMAFWLGIRVRQRLHLCRNPREIL